MLEWGVSIDRSGVGFRVGHLQFREVTFKEMEALLYGLPFHIILRSVVVQAIRGSPPGRSATLRKEGLKAKLEFCLFSQVECVYLGEEQRGGASISDTRWT